ncbi:MAG TPA: TAT-variant-translocated molybdopterin oxidoreductase [Humisphaera sp.]|jgi:molybdopterin-containing oxidoreductase family iron-sulfur binding subunit|nr:TAT-variant-translocated molybdopterin oxidoreductase [Humisphaera sp.]
MTNDSSTTSAKRYWRSLEELSDAADVQRRAMDEFVPSQLDDPDAVSRRGFMKVIGASAALAGFGAASGCKRKADETIVPYVSQPQGVVPGKPLYFATAMTLGGYAQGIVAQSREGRPVKLEGNPDHPASLGASDVFMQAALLGLYDPDRSQAVTYGGNISGWDSFIGAIRPRLETKQKNGSGLAILTETITSPTLIDQIARMKKQYPGARWFGHDPIDRENVRAGLRQATHKEILPRYDFSKARVIVSLDSNFLQDEPGHVRYGRDFIDGRRIRAGTTEMNRLYVIESTHTITGSMADHRWAVRPSEIAEIARSLADILRASGALSPSSGTPGEGRGGGSTQPASIAQTAPTLTLPRSTGGGANAQARDWLRAIAKDLLALRGKSLVVAGAHQPPEVHAIVHSINEALGNIGATVIYGAPIESQPDGLLPDLVAEMDRGAVDLLVILGGNPAYTAPADLNFAQRLENFSIQGNADGSWRNLTVHSSLYEDETSFRCQWHLPQAHFLEEWSDVAAYDGTVSIVQPLIEPLYGGRSAIEVMHVLLETWLGRGYDIVRGFWREKIGENFEAAWTRGVARGVLDVPGASPTSPSSHTPGESRGGGSTQPALTAQTAPTLALPRGTGGGNKAGASESGSEFELIFRPDPNIWDGCFANNGWLQELAKPLTKLTWDNAALLSATSAAQLDVHNGEMLRITTSAGTLDVPALILPGQPDQTITLHLGYGRVRAGNVGNNVGFNAYTIRENARPWITTAKVARTGEKYPLVTTHAHQTIAQRGLPGPVPLEAGVVAHPNDENLDNRRLVRVGTLSQFVEDPMFAKKLDESQRHSLTLYPGYENVYKQNLAWGMSIDTHSCIGCNACVIACQAENNIPVVGKDQVSRGREMHWIRIDTYFEGTPEAPSGTFHQPIPCMQCENAPCELVCPVGATVHDTEGINDMVYNRCVGTRYCSNNCPYKVRRFNFLSYNDYNTETLKLARNPEVTVRSRGVMEKCTYCIQRITATRIEMEKLQVELEEQARHAEPAEAEEFRRKSAKLRQQLLDKLQTACQQSCPTEAIVFGNLNSAVDPIHEIEPDHMSKVKSLKAHPLDYGLLEELTTRPRTTYLARITNPNPEVHAS